MVNTKLAKLNSDVRWELVNNILPFWSEVMADSENGGFLGKIDGSGTVHKDADKGAVLNFRILWTFSSAYNILRNPDYLKTAQRSEEYVLKNFFDDKYGGVYWLIDNKGRMKDGKKQIYAQAFAIYALSEYHRITKDSASLEKAIDLFLLIEKHSFDNKRDGYFEAFSREWGELKDFRLSSKDANEKKTMNTHLHILEAYTNLYRVWNDNFLKQQLKGLIMIFLDKIVDSQTFYLNLFFDENWNNKTDLVSYGHNIEASWLIYEAALVLGDDEVLKKTIQVCLNIAEASKDGVMADGSMIYEKFFKTRHSETDRHWWVQAEAVVGFLNAWNLSENEEYLNLALSSWRFISENLIDRKNGEWFWSVDDKLIPNLKEDKAGFWKCPYHNSRMCLEILK